MGVESGNNECADLGLIAYQLCGCSVQVLQVAMVALQQGVVSVRHVLLKDRAWMSRQPERNKLCSLPTLQQHTRNSPGTMTARCGPCNALTPFLLPKTLIEAEIVLTMSFKLMWVLWIHPHAGCPVLPTHKKWLVV